MYFILPLGGTEDDKWLGLRQPAEKGPCSPGPWTTLKRDQLLFLFFGIGFEFVFFNLGHF